MTLFQIKKPAMPVEGQSARHTRMTGFDFFVNLPAKIGAEQAAKIEAANPANSSVWW
jgi:hypothetical protein